MNALEPGLTIDIVFGKGRVRRSSIQDLKEDRIVLLQTFPPLDACSLEKHILITYVKFNKKPERFGFWAEILELREGYVTTGRGFPAVIVKPLTKIVPCDLRTHQRLKPEPGLEVRFATEDLEIVNISRGGAQLIRRPGCTPAIIPDNMIILTISAGDTVVFRTSRVIRLWHTKGSFGPEHFAVMFLQDLPPSLALK